MSFKLKVISENHNSPSELLMENYGLWKSYLKETDSGFFMIYRDFLKFLPELTTGALKLYLFYGFHSKNNTGESWYSIDTIAKELGTSARSINTWNKELESLGLIYRIAENKSSKTTILLPYSDYIFKVNKRCKAFMDDYYNDSFLKDFLGDVYDIYHLYQWRKRPDSDVYDYPFNLLIIAFKKEHTLPSLKKDIRFRYAQFNLDDFYDFEFYIKPKYMDENTPLLTFDSPITFNNQVDTKGLVINPRFDLLKEKNLKEVLTQLQENVDFSFYNKIHL